MKKNKNVSINEPMKDDVKGAANQILFLSLSKIWTSINWEIRNAVPDPIAIRIDINSESGEIMPDYTFTHFNDLHSLVINCLESEQIN